MPELKHIPELPHENLDNEPLVSPLDAIKNTYALQLVTQTFSNYESYRFINHDRRFNEQDRLYTGFVPAKVWPNTNIPRSSIPFNLTFDQIESAHPSISQALFGSGEWFDVEAGRGTPPQNLVMIEDHLRFILEHARNDFGGTGINELKLATKDVIYRGNGGVFIEWNDVQKRPILSWVDLRDIYVDPGLSVPNLDEARSIIRRKMFTVKELIEYRGVPNMKIPDDNELYTLSTQSPYATADQTKSQQEAIQGRSYFPNSTDIPANPSDRLIECLIFYSKDRIIWVLNRKVVVYNERNPYKFIPFCFAPCYIYPGRWYAMGIPDVQEHNQRYIEALLNARLDRIHLSLEPPRLMKRSTLNTPGNNRWHPGKIVTVDDKTDYDLVQPQDVIPNVFSEIEFIQNAAERRTGINGFGMGVPRGGNVNRTATGVNAQVSGGSMRLLDIVENIENYMLIPMLYKLYHMISLHTGMYDFLDARTADGQMYRIPAQVFNSRVNFVIRASSKMVTREKLLQIFPFITQYLLNGPFLEQLGNANQTVDPNELLRFLQDAAGTSEKYTLIRPLSPEEIQQRQQAQQQAQQAQQQKQNADLQTRVQIQQMKSQTELQKVQMQKQTDPALLQIEQQKAQMEMQTEMLFNQMKLQFEKELAQIKIQAEREKNQQQIQAKRAQSELQAQATQNKIQNDAVASRQKMLIDSLMSASNLEFTAKKNNQQLELDKMRAMMKPRINESQKPEKKNK